MDWILFFQVIGTVDSEATATINNLNDSFSKHCRLNLPSNSLQCHEGGESTLDHLKAKFIKKCTK